MKGSRGVRLLGVHICTVLEQPFQDFQFSLLVINVNTVKWCQEAWTTRIYVGTVCHQQLSNLQVPPKH
jgi:hypothetical protein